jgi:hypothetical protein
MDVAFDKMPIDVVVGLPRLLFVVPLCRVNAPSCGLHQNKGPSEVELSTGQIPREKNVGCFKNWNAYWNLVVFRGHY